MTDILRIPLIPEPPIVTSRDRIDRALDWCAKTILAMSFAAPFFGVSGPGDLLLTWTVIAVGGLPQLVAGVLRPLGMGPWWRWWALGHLLIQPLAAAVGLGGFTKEVIGTTDALWLLGFAGTVVWTLGVFSAFPALCVQELIRYGGTATSRPLRYVLVCLGVCVPFWVWWSIRAV